MMRPWRWWCACTALGVLGCTGTEVGNPPFAPEPESDAGFDLEVPELFVDPMRDARTTDAVFRIPETAVPAEATVHVANLDDDDPVQVLEPDGAGMFVATVSAVAGSVLRVQLRDPSTRFGIVDYRVSEVRGLEIYAPVHAECLRFEARDVAPRDEDPNVIVVRARNDCADPLTLTPRLRIAAAGFSLESSEAVTLAIGEIATFRVALDEPTGAAVENHLLLRSATPADERFAVTLRSVN
jgi:hypothetical protein